MCDKRRPLSQTAPLFPAADFGLVESEEDEVWVKGQVRRGLCMGEGGGRGAGGRGAGWFFLRLSVGLTAWPQCGPWLP